VIFGDVSYLFKALSVNRLQENDTLLFVHDAAL